MTGRFQPRPTRPTGVLAHGGYRIKWYEITLDGRPVAPSVALAARRLADEVCGGDPEPDGVGFAIIHHGAESVWLLVDRWQGDIVSQHLWSADFETPDRFTPVPAGGPTACVWELAVHGRERDAFIRHVLDPVDGPDLDAYLRDVRDDVLDTTATEPDINRRRRDVLAIFSGAWADGDVDTLMTLMADDPVYRPSAVTRAGFEYRGAIEVREGFESIIKAERAASVAPLPDDRAVAPTAAAPTIVELFGDRALSHWSFAAVEGVDLWTFVGDRIAAKEAYRRVIVGDHPPA